ncbi:MAG: hypothetical protein AAF998_08865 [Bacteroidota bacterium]
MRRWGWAVGCLLSLCLAPSLHGQTPPEVNLVQGKVMSTLPYGTPYYLVGDRKSGNDKIGFVVIAVDKAKDRKQTDCFTDGNWEPYDSSQWRLPTGTDPEKYKLPLSRPLTLGQPYRITVKSYTLAQGSATLMTNLMGQLQQKLTTKYNDKKWLNNEQFSTLLSRVEQELEAANPDLYHLDPAAGAMQPGINAKELRKAQDWIKATINSVARQQDVADKQKKADSFATSIETALSEREKLNFTQYLNRTVGITRAERDRILAFLADPQAKVADADLIIEVLNKIAVAARNSESTDLSASLVKKLDGINENAYDLQTEVSDLNGLKKSADTEKNRAKSLKPQLEAAFNSLGVVSSTGTSAATTDNQSLVNVGTTLGLGTVGYFYGRESSDGQTDYRLEPDLITYTALKIHWGPRDKSLKIPEHVYPYCRSRWATLIGVATSGLLNFRGQNQDNALSITPLTGISYDLGRAAEIDFGLIWYRQNTLSDASSRKVLKASAFIGISFDFDVLNRLSGSKNKVSNNN